MSEPSTLPENWETVIDRIDAQLQTAIAAADARAAALPSATDEPASTARRGDLAALAARMQALQEHVGRSQTTADEADAVLTAGAEFLRWRLAEAESLHARLKEWALRQNDPRGSQTRPAA